MAKKLAKKTPLVSSRYAAMFIPNTTGWEFFDAFGKSDQCQAAFADSELSTTKRNVNKYLAKTANERLRIYRESQKTKVPQPPLHILELLKLQSSTGKFDHLDQVLSCLFMPPDVKFRHDDMFVTWEKATAFAIAAMRQQNQYFDVLCEAHDKAFGWMESNEIIFEARELLNTFQFSSVGSDEMKEGSSDLTPRSRLSTNDLENMNESESTLFSHQSTVISNVQDPVLPPAKSAAVSQIVIDDNTNITLTTPVNATGLISTADLVQSYNGLLQTIDESNDDASAASFDKSDGALSDFGDTYSTRPSSPNFNALQDRLHELTANRDEVKIAAQQEVVNRLQLEVISQCIRIEKLVEEVHVVAERCIKLYRDSETTAVRCKQFDELTCMLGEGRPPTKGFTDWKEQGVVGVRPIMIQFFLTVQTLAEERLTLQELETPQGRRLGDKINLDHNLGRWKFLWNGHDVVHKVVHCLDFLRKCRELSEWYGPSFYFVANPLMLPFPLHTVYENKTLNMAQKVYDQQMTAPHVRLGNMNIALKSEWQHQQYLNQWRRDFQAAAECWAFNWPTVPDIRLEVDNERLYTCLLVIYTTCAATLQKSYLWEKKFISQIHSVRGRDKFLIGENTAKVDKKLDIPSAVARTRKQSVLDDLDLENKTLQNRKASTASFADYGYYSVDGSRSKSSGVNMDFSTEEDGADHFSQFSSPEVLRPHLAQAMKFTKTLQSAVEKAALRAQKIREQLAAVRKASVLPGSPQQLGQGQGGRRGTNMSFIGQKSRSPSIAVGGRRTSSRPSLSAGAGSVGGIGSIGGVGAGGFGSPSRHGTLLRKSSSAGATGMNGTGGAGGGEAADGSAQTRRESTVRKNSTSPGLQARTNGTGRNTGGSLLLQKGSSFGISSTPTSPTFSPAGSPVRSDSMGNLSGFGGHTGKFKPSFHARSDSKLGGRSAHHTILEEDSGSVIGGVGSPTEDGVKSSPGSGKRGKSLQGSRQSSPSKLGASSPAKRSTGADSIAIKAGPVGAAGAGGAATAAASKPVSRAGSRLSVSSKGSSATTTAATAYAGSKTDGAATAENITSGAGGGSGTPAKIPGERNSRSNNRKSSSAAAAPLLARNSSTSGLKLPPPINTDLASSKSMRFTVTAPTLTEGSESSDHTGSPAKPKKGRKKSTVRASSLAEMSVDNTTVSLALASPPRVSSPGAGNKNNNTSTGGGHVKKKRGTILAGEKGLQNNQPRISSIVTRLPPVQGDVRLTRRKGE